MSEYLPPVVAELRASISDFQAKMGTAKAEMSATGAHAQSTFGNMASLGKGALLGIAGAAVAVGVVSLKMAGDFQESMTQLVTGAGESEKNIGLVSNGILNMAAQVGTSTKQLSAGMYMIESAGFHGAGGLNVLKVAAEGARVGNAQLADVANAVTSALNAYHEPASDATAVMNTLTATVANGKMHMQDLAGALATVMPAAAAIHVPLVQVGAALATMTMQGIGADNAATYLRFTLMSLVNPTSKARGEMESMGITSSQVADKLTHEGLPQALAFITDAISTKFKPGSAEYTAALANMVGGTRGLQAALALTGTHLSVLNANVTAITGKVASGGTAVAGWANIQKDFNFKLDQAKTMVEVLAIRIGLWLIPKVEEATRVGLAMVGWLERHKTIAEALGIAIGTVLVVAIVAYTVAMVQAAIATVAATWPILAIIAAVALVGVAIFELATHWKQVWNDIKQWIADAWHFIKDHLAFIAVLLGPAGPMLVAAVFLIDHWRTIWGDIQTVVEGVWHVMKPIFDAIKRAIEDIISAVEKAIDALSKVGSAASHIPGAGKGGGNIISGIGGALGLAEGGLVTKPTLALIGEGGGPELVLPLNNPARMAELLKMASVSLPSAPVLSGASGGSSSPSAAGPGVSIMQRNEFVLHGTSQEILDQMNRAIEHNNAELVRTIRSITTY